MRPMLHRTPWFSGRGLTPALRAQCVVLSEGYNLYFGAPERVLGWFSDTLGYPYDYSRDGAVSDWLMDLVSVGFQKPASFRDRRAGM